MITIKILLFLSVPMMKTAAQLCGYCEIDGTHFRGNSFFVLDRGCNQYTCRCRCDGSFYCPPALTKAVCQTVAGEGTPGPQLQDCTVVDRIFRPGHFYIEHSCTGYNCNCYSDGSWSCPADGITNICQEPEINEEEEEECIPCNVYNESYGPGPFQFRAGCLRYDCQCSCDGTFSCPAERTVFLCGDEN